MTGHGGSDEICVVIAAWNAAPTVARAVRSALAQPEVAEVVVVDDASSDATAAEAQACDDGSGRLKVVRLERNGGPSAARNHAIAISASPWIAILDADDFLMPGRMGRLLKHAADTDLVADDLLQVDEGAEEGPARRVFGEEAEVERVVDFRTFVLGNISEKGRTRTELGFIKPLMRRAFLDEHGIRYDEGVRLGEDYDLYARALAKGARLILLPAQGYVSVVRADSLSGKHSEEDLLHLRECDARLLSLPNLTKEERAAVRRHFHSVDCRLQWRRLISAVKGRDLKSAVAPFFRPHPVPLYLWARLTEQLWLRSLGRT